MKNFHQVVVLHAVVEDTGSVVHSKSTDTNIENHKENDEFVGDATEVDEEAVSGLEVSAEGGAS